MTAGYGPARERAGAVGQSLRDLALLIGEPRSERVSLQTGGSVVPGLGLIDDATMLERRAADLEQGLFKIIVLGEFKNGKSTLLNGMLGGKVLPAKAAPSTAIITMLVYGDSPEVAIFETGKPQPRYVSWENFVEEFQLTKQDQETLQDHGFVDRFSEVEYAQVECLHPICAQGVKLIDSPGLGEHVGRTRIATSFLRQAQAVILVLNATRILTQDEKEFVEQVLGSGRLNHVFFVVNRVNQIDQESVEEIKSWVERALAHHFCDERGRFDRDLYRRRVFFVNARGALDARSTIPPDTARLESSGVPELEAELERFLTSEEKVRAALESTLQLLRPVSAQAQQRITQASAALDQPLQELEQRRVESERRLRTLQGRKNEMERTILLFGETIKRKVYADLQDYVEQMRETWDEDSHKYMNLDQAVGIRQILATYTQEGAREEMARAIAREVQRYLQAKFGQWAERIPVLIQPDIEKMTAEVEAQVGDFQLELDQIASLFAGTLPSRKRSDGAGATLLEVALTLGDISGMTDLVMGRSDWGSMIGRIAQQAVLVWLIGTLLTGGNFLIAGILMQVVRLGTREGEIKKKIRETLGQRLLQNLAEQVASKQAWIYQTIEQTFAGFATAVTRTVQVQIDELRAEQERILRQRRDERFSVEQEKERLRAIEAKLNELVESLVISHQPSAISQQV